MAVFPDRIVLKNSTDSQAAIEAAIQTGGSDAITQGEIVLGVENANVKFYTKAGDGSIVSLGGTGTGPYILAEITDVDLSTPATDGQVIAYNSTSGNWEPVNQSVGYTDPLTTDGDVVIRSGGTTTRLGIGSEGQVLTVSSGLPVWAAATGGGLDNIAEDTTPQLGGNLDVNGNYIVSASGGDVVVAPDTTGDFIVRGNNTDGSITLNCTANTHGVTIQSPPHADAATYTLILPSSAGTAGQVLTSQGGLQLTWEDAATAGSVASIDDVGDVDTTTVPPTDGQALVWDNTAGQWEPGTVSGGGAVDSVNGQTGDVSLGIQDMDDFALNAATGTSSVTRTVHFTQTSDVTSGNVGTGIIGYGYTYWCYNPEGSGASNILSYLRDTATTPIDVDINGTTVTITEIFDESGGDGGSLRLLHPGLTSTGSITGSDWTLAIAGSPTTPLAEGDILRWNNTDSKFNPATLAIDSLDDVDTSTPPTDGQVLTWDNAASKWEPGTIPVDSVNGQTGAVVLSASDLDDVASPDLLLTDRQDHSGWTFTGNSENWDAENLGPSEQAWFFFHLDVLPAFQTLNVNDPVTFSSPGIADHVTTVAQTAALSGGIQYRIVVTDSWPSAWLNLAAGSDVTPSVTSDPNDGAVLAWNPVSQKWEPTSLAKVSPDLSVYADNAAAKTGGLVDGDLYRTATGGVNVVYT